MKENLEDYGTESFTRNLIRPEIAHKATKDEENCRVEERIKDLYFFCFWTSSIIAGLIIALLIRLETLL